jgi:hypothetical protein
MGYKTVCLRIVLERTPPTLDNLDREKPLRSGALSFGRQLIPVVPAESHTPPSVSKLR